MLLLLMPTYSYVLLLQRVFWWSGVSSELIWLVYLFSMLNQLEILHSLWFYVVIIELWIPVWRLVFSVQCCNILVFDPLCSIMIISCVVDLGEYFGYSCVSIFISDGSWFGAPQVIFPVQVAAIKCSWVLACWSMKIWLSGIGATIVNDSNMLVGVS